MKKFKFFSSICLLCIVSSQAFSAMSSSNILGNIRNNSFIDNILNKPNINSETKPASLLQNSRVASMIATDYRESSTDSFPDTIIYDDGHYYGVLRKEGTSYVSSGYYTPEKTKYVYGTTWHDRLVTEYADFTGQQESPRIYGTNSEDVSNKMSQLGSMGISYRSSWVWLRSEGTLPTEEYSDSEGYKGTLSILGQEKDGRYKVDLNAQRWDYPACSKGVPVYNIAVYWRTDKVQLEGNVTKPAVDTRVYKQKYSGTVTNKDTIPPTVNDISYNWSSADSYTISVPATDTGGSGLSEIALYDSNNNLVAVSSTSPLKYVYSPTQEGCNVFYAIAVDDAENYSRTATIKVNIDKTKPTVSFSPSDGRLSNSNINVTLNVSDSLSGVKSWKYAVTSGDGTTFGAWIDGSGTSKTVALSNQGKYKFKISVTDNAGNVFESTSAQYIIDKIIPSVKFSPMEKPWTQDDISVFVQPSTNGGSDISYWQYRLSSDGGLSWGGWSSNQPISGTTIKFSTTGKWIIEAKVCSIAGNSGNYKSGLYLLDKTLPTCNIEIPSTTASRNITLKFTNILDSDSGIKEISIGNYRNNAPVTIKLNKDQTTLETTFELVKKDSPKDNYGQRYIYVYIKDNVNNIKEYVLSTTLTINKPSAAIITNPENDQLFSRNENIDLQWFYFDMNNELEIPLEKIDIVAKNKSTNKTIVNTVDGLSRAFLLSNLEDGYYDISVITYISDTIFSESEPVSVRVNAFKTEGLVKTVLISSPSKLRYVAVSTDAEIPTNTEILGKIYYSLDSDGVSMDKSKVVSFKITEKYIDNIIKLPDHTSNIVVEYSLYNNSKNFYLTPVLDSIVVYAK